MNDTIAFNIHRKPTNTDRIIPNTSYHTEQTKLAAFNSFCFRAIKYPLSDLDFENERQKIYVIADVNGYNRKIVDNLLLKYQRKKELQELTTLTPINGDDTTNDVDDEPQYYTGGIFVKGLTTKIKGNKS